MSASPSSSPAVLLNPPLRCIAHVDMDCFYAQVEAVRLGIDCRTTPLVLAQWGSLIAVNYPARARGIKRLHHTVKDAAGLCPEVVVALSPSYKVGEAETRYHPNPRQDTHKISLEPYRHASRQIFAILSSEPYVVVEKGSVDEAYVDVTEAAVQELVALRCAERTGDDAVPLDALTEVMEPSTRLIADRSAEMEAWFGEHGASLESVYDAPMRALRRGEVGREVEGSRGFCVGAEAQYEARCLLLCAATRVVHRLRQRIRAELHYDCSAGIAHNRVLAKCISATHKPNQQTLLLPDRSASALFDLPLRELRGFGGKFGAAVKEVCGGAAMCRDLWLVPLAQLYALDGKAVDIGIGGGVGDHAEEEEGEDSGKGIRMKRPVHASKTSGRGYHVLHGPIEDVVRHDTSLYAYYRMRGLSEDTVVNRPLSKSLMASKNLDYNVTDVVLLRQWVIVLTAELCARYAYFTELYGLRGRNLNVKLGCDGFWSMDGVLNKTVPLPAAMQPDILAAVTMSVVQTAFQRDPQTSADSVTLTIGGFVADNGGGGGDRRSYPLKHQRTLHAFLMPCAETTAAAAVAAECSIVVLGSSRSSSSSRCGSAESCEMTEVEVVEVPKSETTQRKVGIDSAASSYAALVKETCVDDDGSPYRDGEVEEAGCTITEDAEVEVCGDTQTPFKSERAHHRKRPREGVRLPANTWDASSPFLASSSSSTNRMSRVENNVHTPPVPPPPPVHPASTLEFFFSSCPRSRPAAPVTSMIAVEAESEGTPSQEVECVTTLVLTADVRDEAEPVIIE